MFIIVFALILLSIIYPMMGSVMLWRKYNYFHDGLVHALIFVSVISALLNVSLSVSIVIFAALFSFFIIIIQGSSNKNSVIALVSNGFLSIALLINSITGNSVLLENILFGDILLINSTEVLVVICSLLLLYCIFLALSFRNIILLSIDRNIAITNGVNLKFLDFIILFITSLTIGLTVKFTGILIIGALLIIPVLSASLISSSPISTILKAITINIISACMSIFFAFGYDLPIAPLISCINISVYLFLKIWKNNI